MQSGTGFIWDGAGNIVTNNHVVPGTSELAVRFASGAVVQADVVGTAPNYGHCITDILVAEDVAGANDNSTARACLTSEP